MKITKKPTVEKMLKIAEELEKKTGHSCKVQIACWKFDHLEKPSTEFSISIVPTGNGRCNLNYFNTWEDLQKFYLKVKKEGI